MEKLRQPKEVIVAYNASGAARAASLGFVVVIVDVIDMSTSAEAALENGAFLVLGASPDNTKLPFKVDPYKIGKFAGKMAKELDTEIIVVSEPRCGSHEQMLNSCQKLTEGIKESGAAINKVLPNLGAEIANMADFQRKIVVCVSAAGGVAFDAAWQVHHDVVTGTIARTIKTKGKEPARKAAQRAIDLAQGRNIAVVAASANSLEDVLGAHFIAQTIMEMGYLNS
ncbi:MAG: hypothetical protein GXW85_13550 [Clostridia bacterium]|nr:hypothetical protein [Clostridia bacterium]